MNRVSHLSSSEDFVLETKREALRDWRWRRRRSKIGAVICCAVGLELAHRAPSILQMLTKWL